MKITKEEAEIILVAIKALRTIEALMEADHENNEELKLAKKIIKEFPELKEKIS